MPGACIMNDVINIYNDIAANPLDGFGIDISTQRADDLDNGLLSLISANENTPLNIIDLGCGKGGQTLRMAALGCNITAVDIQDFEKNLHTACKQLHIPKSRITFVQADIRNAGEYLKGNYHYIYSQRAIHYLPYNDAAILLNRLREYLTKDFPSKLFISVSGLHSELGNGYADKDKNIASRFCPLSAEMGEKHKILLPVCLYAVEELGQLLMDCHYTIEKLYASPFGNIKAVSSL
jgi:SAM-dependent methyltransferase